MKPGDIVYGSRRDLWGYNALGNIRTSYNKKVRILTVDEDAQTCTVELLSGFLEEIGSQVSDVPLSRLSPTASHQSGTMPFYPEKQTILLGPVETGGYQDKALNLRVLSGMWATLLFQNYTVLAPQVWADSLTQEHEPLQGRQLHSQWEPYFSHLIRHAEQILIFTSPNWGESQELDRLLSGMVSKRFANLFRVFRISEEFQITAFAGDKNVSSML